MSYALPGVADGGGQTYPSSKIYAYDLGNLKDAGNNWSMDTREANGTLDDPARIGYSFPGWMQTIPILTVSDASSELFKIENYHCARGLVYMNVSYCYTDE